MMKQTLCNAKMLVAAGVLLLTAACVDNSYDIGGGISTDIKITDNKLTLPLGDLKAMRLDSLLGTESGLLEVDENGYGINMEGTIDTVSLDIDRITLPGNTFTVDEAFAMDDLQLDALEVPGFTEKVDIDFSGVTKDDLNADLPSIKEQLLLTFSEADFSALMERLTAMGLAEHTFEGITANLHTGDQQVPFDFTTRLPEELKTLHRIELCEKDGSGAGQGALVLVTLTHPAKFNGMTRTFSFDAVFPAEFELAVDADAEHPEAYTLEKGAKGHANVVHVKDLVATGNTSELRLRILSMEDIEDYHVEKDGVQSIDYHSEVSYSVDYATQGTMCLSSSDDIAEYGVGITLSTELGVADAEIVVNAIQGDFPTTNIPFDVDINNVQYVKHIGILALVPEKSRLTLRTATDKPIDGFTMDANSPIVVQLPTNYHLDLVEGPETASWNRRTGTLTLYSLDDLLGAEYVFETESVDINADVVDGSLHIGGQLSVGTKNGEWQLLSKATRLSQIIDAIGPRTLTVTLEPTVLTVEDLDIDTDDIVETLCDTSAFNIDVPLDMDIIEKAYALWPENDISLSLDAEVLGLEKIDTDVEADLTLTVPAFICLSSDDPDVTVEDNRLHLSASLSAKDCSLHKTLRVSHFDFTRLEGGYLAPTVVDGETRLQLTSSLIVEGQLKIGATNVSLSQLGDGVALHAAIAYDDITVRMFEGVLKYAIDPVETTVDIASDASLSEILDNVSIVLSDPQISVDITNPIGVPLLADLTIEGLDAQGTVIAASAVDMHDVLIHAAVFDAAANTTTPTTTHLLFAAHDMTVEGYETVVVPALANILKVVPHTLRMRLAPRLDGSVTHHVDILQPIKVYGAYRLSVPLQFDELHLHYDMNDIEVSFGDFSKYLSKASMSLKMNARNTIPVGLKIALVPLDAAGQELSYIHVTPVEIPAGDGSAISNNSPSSEVEFAFSADNCDFTSLSRLCVSAEAFTDHTEGGIALRPEQGFLLTDVVLTVIADIETTLN